MKSIKEIYSIGKGPSSSHTMGPRKASLRFLSENPSAVSFRVTLYGSPAATGAEFALHTRYGHLFIP